MDINSLLSPQDTPTGETPPPLPATSSPYQSPNKRPGRPTKRTSSTLSHQLVASPRTPQEQLLTPTLSHNGMQLPHLPLPSPGILNAQQPRSVHSATSTPSTDGRTSQPPFHRTTSTPGMDTLADLASMQHQHQHPARPAPVPNVNRTLSVTSIKDIAMDGSPRTPKTFTTRALSAEDQQALSTLYQSLQDKPFDYTWNIQYIGLLRKGFLNSAKPAQYELLGELRQARASMDSRYAIGEQAWAEWIQDEQTTIQNYNDRLKVLDLFGKALADEPTSALLWRLYGDYLSLCYHSANGLEGGEAWPEEDVIIGKEIFTKQFVLEVWEQGANATKWRINDSNTVWDPYLEFLQTSQPVNVPNVNAIFTSRLLQPHATWDATFQMYSSFVSKHYNADYERIMESVSKQAAHAKKQYAMRESFELKISSAQRAGDREAEWNAWKEYQHYELTGMGIFSFNFVNGFFQRITTHYHNDSSFWVEYVEFLIQNPSSEVNLLAVLERATRHCPWSGQLFSLRILALEDSGKTFHEIEAVKHSATESGLLEAAGIQELLEVLLAWCGFLRRRAFQTRDATEDDTEAMDIAEVGIRSAIESAREVGERQLGSAWKGDPQFRLERIHIKFLLQANNIAAARDIWRSMVNNHASTLDFWSRWYTFEMAVWGSSSMSGPPEEATKVLRNAMQWLDTIDYPEALVTSLTNHIQQHENVHEILKNTIETREANAQIAKRRQKEQAEAAAAFLQQQQNAQPSASVESSTKRKREGEPTATAKRTKPDAESPPADIEMAEDKGEASNSVAAQIKRDRENATIVVKNLSTNTTETGIRKFFSSCGTVVSINIHEEEPNPVAVVEFESSEEAEYAFTAKQGMTLDGNEIEISKGSRTVVYVANYTPTADEAYIRNLFREYGDVVSVRFPSLKYNTHRRFCYVQFATQDQATAATQLDGKPTDDGYNIVVKLSDPNRKKDREGAAYEGREVFVKNVHWKAGENDVKAWFLPYGKVESIRIPRKVDGNSKGVAFVVMNSKEEAEKAVAGLHGQEFMTRALHCELSKPQPKAKRQQTTQISSASPEPSNIDQHKNGDGDRAHYKERSIAILDLPDTVNDAKVRSLCEPYGPLRKIKLLHDHQGAIVEYVNVGDARKAGLAIDGREIIPGRRIRIGTVAEMLKSKEEFKHDKLTERKKPSSGSTGPQATLKLASGFVSRPAQAGAARRGGRGGLGFRTGKVGTGGSAPGTGDKSSSTDKTETTAPSESKKSQADFRAMLGSTN